MKEYLNRLVKKAAPLIAAGGLVALTSGCSDVFEDYDLGKDKSLIVDMGKGHKSEVYLEKKFWLWSWATGFTLYETKQGKTNADPRDGVAIEYDLDTDLKLDEVDIDPQNRDPANFDNGERTAKKVKSHAAKRVRLILKKIKKHKEGLYLNHVAKP